MKEKVNHKITARRPATGKKSTRPMEDKEDVPKSNDEHIDQDFPGFPGNPSKENIIRPRSKEDHDSAGTSV